MLPVGVPSVVRCRGVCDALPACPVHPMAHGALLRRRSVRWAELVSPPHACNDLQVERAVVPGR